MLVSLHRQQTVLDRNTNTNKVKTTAGHIFSKCMHVYMQFLIVKINTFTCILNGACIAVPVLRYWN